MRDAIEVWEAKLKTTEGKDAFTIKKALIEMRKDQYIIKTFYRHPIIPTKLIHSKTITKLDDNIESFDEDGYPVAEGFTLMNPEVCSAILCNYSRLKQDSYNNFEGDTWSLMYDFDKISEIALRKHPLYERLVEYKIDGL